MRAARITALAVLAVLAVAELSARALEPRLERHAEATSAAEWPHPEVAAKYEQVRRFRERGRRFDMVLVGSSSVAHGIDPALLGEGIGRSVYNAAIPGSSVEAISAWLLDIVEPALQPQAVVLGLVGFELNDNGRNGNRLFQRLVNAPGFRREAKRHSLSNRIERAVEDRSVFFRYRRVIRNPHSLWRALRGKSPKGNPTARMIGRLGERPAGSGDRTYEDSPEIRRAWRVGGVNDFALGGTQREALVELSRELDRRGVRLVLVLMPYTRDYVEVHPRRDRDVRAYFRLVEEFSEERSVPVLDATAAIPGTDGFRDNAHLGPVGRERFTELLVRSWDRLGELPGRGWVAEVASAGARR